MSVTTVWKFPLALWSQPQSVSMPSGATVVHVHDQIVNGADCPVLWAAVNPTNPKVSRTFQVFATGEEITVPVHRYVGTVHIGWTVWHIYEHMA